MRYYSRTEPVGYVFNSSLFCAGCGEHLPDIDPEGNDKGAVFAWQSHELTFDYDGEQCWHECEKCGVPADVWGTLR